MIHAIIYNNSFDVLLYGWGNSTLLTIFIIEIVGVIAGVSLGVFTPNNSKKYTIISLVGIVGLLLIFKMALLGPNSDAEIMFPFIGETLLVGVAVTFLASLCKRKRGQ